MCSVYMYIHVDVRIYMYNQLRKSFACMPMYMYCTCNLSPTCIYKCTKWGVRISWPWYIHVQVDYPPTQFVIGERDRDRENKMASMMGSNPHWLVAKELLCRQARLPTPCTCTCTCVVYMHCTYMISTLRIYTMYVHVSTCWENYINNHFVLS